VIRTFSPEGVVLDASAMVDLLTGEGTADPIRLRLRGTAIHVPAHFDAEVLSAVGWRVDATPIAWWMRCTWSLPNSSARR
jgi:predicted nucleic acid-binding protein